MQKMGWRERRIEGKVLQLGSQEAFYALSKFMLEVDTSKPFDKDWYPTNRFFKMSTYSAIAKMHESGDKEYYRIFYDKRLAKIRRRMAYWMERAHAHGLTDFDNIRYHYEHYTGKKIKV